MTRPPANHKPPSFPTLLAEESRAGITEYLSTTFALADSTSRDALAAFLSDPERGIFRGPYLRLRTPFPSVDASWACPLDWMPQGFVPFRHQAAAFERLSTRDGPARPTIVTTGTGSGKTESFLVPILDHARRARARGEAGIKAIVLYPMNALVTDQARRLANLLHDEPDLAGVTAGVYIGGEGTRNAPIRDGLVDKKAALRLSPPDILLTNYKMLDILLLRSADAALWSASTTSLQYVVLDEFHTYDGAQGTDVAMLLRRLGATCRVAEPGRPLGRIVPVATSATLGGGTRSEDLRAFARTIFGTTFDTDAVVVEERLDADDVVPEIDFDLGIPDVDALLDAPMPVADAPSTWAALAENALASTSSGKHTAARDYTDPYEIGDLLRHHFLTKVVIEALGDGPVTPAEAVRTITQAGVLPWGVRDSTDPAVVQRALLRFLTLLSIGRVRDASGRPRPLVSVQVQLWVRELTRMLRRVDATPEFGWWHDGIDESTGRWLPAAHCRVCGRSGWMASVTELGDTLGTDPTAVWRASARPSSRNKTRALLLAGDDEAGVQFLDPSVLALATVPADGSLAVHVSTVEQAAAQECPSCGARDAIRFLGSSVATLLSVGLTQMFGSDALPPAEQKTLVFTDSVQDAAHRAAFIEGRAFSFNFRSALLGAVAESSPTTLPQIAERLRARSTAELYALAPPDFVRRRNLTGEWLAHDKGGAKRKLLGTRIGFQAHLELGLNSRLGRTLELTGAVGVDVDVDLDAAGALARDVHENLPEYVPITGTGPAPMAYQRWLLGLLDRLRSRGGIHHRWLDSYIKDDGRRWSIWGGSADGMPKFPDTRPAPGFLTTGVVGRSEFIGLRPRGDSWVLDWTRRCLGVATAEARALLAPVVEALGGEDGPLERRTSGSDARVYGLRPERVLVHNEQVRLQCPMCLHLQPCSPGRAALWDGAPCPRRACEGVLGVVPAEDVNFYRTLYRSRRIRRIVTHEHTGLLERTTREEVERAFTAGTSPVAPNILTCTPTLELGIDIGELSTVALASLPRATANYLQRVGRAGRSTGSAFVFTAVPSSPRDLYYFSEPRHLIDGEVTPPGAYLNATELLCRQFLAFCLDRLAAGDLTVIPRMPPLLGQVLSGGLADDAWLRAVVEMVARQAENLCTDFLAGYMDLADTSRDAVRTFASGGLEQAAARAVLDWETTGHEIDERLRGLAAAITELSSKGLLGPVEQEDLKRCRGEWKATKIQRDERGRIETLTGLTGIGLLPNYNLLDDSTSLDIHLWWPREGEAESDAVDVTYERASRTALTELAPGAYFYAEGKRVEIDAVDVGPAGQPAWRTWRLCPTCGWGVADGAPVASCPRCGGVGVGDAGARHKVLPLRRVSAVHRLDDAVIDDDHEDRTRTFFTTVTGVDIDHSDVVGAWRLKETVFGAEYARRAVVRTLNLGEGDAPGADVDIAGFRLSASRFPTCALCGVVRRRNQPVDDVRHRGFCAVRRGATAQWDDLLLSHELTTQAVRLLLPVSTLMVDTKLVSFVGALVLGLRRDFGGDPQHLSVVTSTMDDGSGRPRRFVVLHDTVPGGTGYLDRFGDPDRLHTILQLARDALAGCPCQAEGRAACHRCLLGVVVPRDIPHAHRRVALDLLDEILGTWDVEEIDTVSRIDIAKVALSELELLFRETVKAWADARDGCSWTASIGPTGEQLDLRLVGPGDEPRRWTMRPLVNVTAGSISTQPDFLLTRSDAQGCDVAVYLDGQAYHASPGHNITDDDAVKRTALRDDDRRVFSLTWADVEGFAKNPGAAVDPDLLVPEARNVAEAQVPDVRVRTIWGNSVGFLLAYLSDPDAEVWGAGAAASVLALVAPGKHGSAPHAQVAPASLATAMTAAATGAAPASDGTLMVVPRHGRSGLPLALVADPENHLATLGALALLDDRVVVVGGTEHEARWRDWLRWANVLQFLVLPALGAPQPLRTAEIWTQRSLGAFQIRHLPLATPAPVPKPVVDIVEPGWNVVIEYSDSSVHGLVSALSGLAGIAPEPGGEVGDDDLWQVELCWPDQHVAVTIDDSPERDVWLAGAGWRVVRYEEDADVTALAQQIGNWVKESA